MGSVNVTCCLLQSLTHWALLVGEEDAAIAAVCVGDVDGVAVRPVEFPEEDRQGTRPVVDRHFHIL